MQIENVVSLRTAGKNTNFLTMKASGSGLETLKNEWVSVFDWGQKTCGEPLFRPAKFM